MKVLKDYTATVDSKKRVTIRGSVYKYYNVKEYTNGCVMLEPRELITPNIKGNNKNSEMVVK